MVKAILAALALLLTLARPALGCTPVSGYRIPDNIQLVEKADLIVLAVVESGPSDKDEAYRSTDVVLRTVEILKGSRPGRPLRLSGFVSQGGLPVEPHPTPLFETHPDAFEGACTRHAFAVGTLVVAMFANTTQGPVALAYPGARQVEDVVGSDDVWPRAVRIYVKALAINGKRARRAALLAKAKELSALTTDPAAREIDLDIRLHLGLARWGSPPRP